MLGVARMFVGFKWAGSWHMMFLWLRLKSEEKLCHSSAFGMDSADTDQSPKREICMDNPHLLPITQPGSSTITSLKSVPIVGQILNGTHLPMSPQSPALGFPRTISRLHCSLPPVRDGLLYGVTLAAGRRTFFVNKHQLWSIMILEKNTYLSNRKH